MIIYCLIYPILTVTLFMVWVFQSTLPGGDIGMAPFLVGLVLLIVFGVEIMLVLIFRKRLSSMSSRVLSLVFAFLLYESTVWVLGGEIVIFNTFKKPFLEDSNMAFSFSSVFALLIIFVGIFINHKISGSKALKNERV